jgi:glycolate oxidase iron-sulfur subunit
MNIAEYYDEIAHCNRCGFCQVACPIFRSTGHEAGVARGRLALLRAIIEGRLEWEPALEEPLYDCLLCGACTSNCFPAIPTCNLLVKSRCEYLEKVGRSPVHRLLFDCLLPYPQRLHFAARAVALGKNTGLSQLAAALGLLRPFGRDFSQAEGIIERLPTKPFRDKTRPGVFKGYGQSLRIAYFVGCGVDIIQQEAAAATLALLQRIGKSVCLIENCCCGLPAWSYGDLEVARKLAEKNLRQLCATDFDILVTDCSSCASYLKKYPDLFQADEPLKSAAERISQKIRDMVEILAETDIPFTRTSGKVSVTYHDPCHASRGQRLVNEPRAILQRLPGITYRELPEANWCCGGAGAYALSHYELSRRVLDRKMENLQSTGADVVVTSCPACMIQLSYGIRQHGLNTKVRHLTQIIGSVTTGSNPLGG